MKWTTCAVIVAAAGLSAPARAETRLNVTIVAISNRSIFIDAGRDKGVKPGATLVYSLPNGERVEVTIQDVSASGARSELLPADRAPLVNSRAEVLTLEEVAPTAEVGPQRPAPVPEHPPWTRTEEPRSPDTPLLAPAFATPPDERPTQVHGRVFADLQGTQDIESRSNYGYARTGVWLQVDNLFQDAGRLLFSGDFDYRGADLTDVSQSDKDLRIERLSYAWGLDEHAPFRVELGRFFSSSLPELGLFDGGEAMLRFQNGWSIGGGVGSYPNSDSDLDTGEDLGFHVFAQYEAEQLGSLSTALGYQQTWHNGSPDRNLIIARVNSRPSDTLWLYGMAMVDLYGSEDDLKDGSVELTQLLAQATWTPDTDTGLTAVYTRTTWPELLREDYTNLPPQLVRDGRVDRASLSGWRRLSDDVRLTARAFYWMDQDDDGFGGELGLDWYEALREGSHLYTSLYYEDAAYNDGLGMRLQTRHDIGDFQLFCGYDVFAYTLTSLSAGSEDYLRHTLRADVSWSLDHWYYNVNLQYLLGDNENAISLGCFVEYRF